MNAHTRSMLIALPGQRLSIRALWPNHRLAALAGALENAGHTTEIRDYGVPETLERLFPREMRATAQAIADRFLGDTSAGALTTLSALWQARTVERALRAQYEKLCAEIADGLAREDGLDFVVFDLEEAEDLKGALAVAARLREKAPSIRRMAMGPLVVQYGEGLAEFADVFDCLCVRGPEWSVVEWAAKLERPEAWGIIPNLAYAHRGRVRVTTECVGLDLDELPAPAYRPDVYPALEDAGKFKLYGVEVSRSSAQGEPAHVRASKTVCDEAARLTALHNVRAFRFLDAAAADVAPSQIDALAYEILARRLTLWYSRNATIHDTRLKSFSALKSSGCQALAFRLDTGSQWLLEDYYRRDFCVTEAEHVLRACKFSGVFTVAQFTYPCPADDYHSRAETLRLVERTRPHAVQIGPPDLTRGCNPLSGSTGVSPSQRGFNFSVQDYLRHLATGRDRFSVPLFHRHASAHFRQLRSLSEVLREHEVLEREIEGIGVSATLSPEVALIARVCGYDGHEQDYSTLLRQHLFAGDAQSVAAAVQRFNGRVSTLAASVPFRVFEPVLAAVGN